MFWRLTNENQVYIAEIERKNIFEIFFSMVEKWLCLARFSLIRVFKILKNLT